jgi:hypothetical protein
MHQSGDIAALRLLSQRFYALCFSSNVGTFCHSFLEFNGLISKYVDLLQDAAQQGADIAALNVHTGRPVPEVADHHWHYLAEKLECIFGPWLVTNPRAREILRREFLGETP